VPPADEDEGTGLPLRGSLTLATGVVGIVVGAGVVVVDYCGWGETNRGFAWTGSFVLWLALICAQMAVWAVAIPLFHRIQKGLGHAREWRVVATSAAVFLFALAGGLAGAIIPDVKGWSSFDYLHGRPWKISLLSFVGAVVAVYGMVGMWRIYYELRSKRDLPVTIRYLATYVKLHGKLQQLITVLGGALGLVVLAAAAERNAAHSWDARVCPHGLAVRVLHELGAGGAGCGGKFPYEFVLVYGFYFTALLGFAYVPVGLALLDVGRRIRASTTPISDAVKDGANLSAWQDKRSKLSEILDLDLGTTTSFRTAIAILTPLIGSLTGLLFKAA
jgi:hypothetical protein